MQTLDSLEEAIREAKRGNQSMVQCRAHDDGYASLHVSPGETQPVIMKCHAGCETDAVLTAANVDLQSILAERDDNALRVQNMWTPAGDASHAYPYIDENGVLLYEVLRVPLPGGKKTFRQRRPDDSKRSGYAYDLGKTRRVLYRLPEVLSAKSEGRRIWVVEGEKDVESLRARGEVATTSAMGAGKWQEDYSEALRGATVGIISDADATGRAHARAVRESLLEVECSVTIYEAAHGKDVTDHLDAGLELSALIETSPEEEDRTESYGIDVLDAVERKFEEKSFVIPNTLARGDRLLITGFEGHGKSTLLRQFAVQVAAGIHPWTGAKFDPQKVLVIDVENHPDQTLESWQNLVGLAARHDAPIQRGQLVILEQWDNEVNLTGEEGASWLIERIHAYKPDMVVMGPLYNMSDRDLKDDETVRKIKKVVNEARGICGTAFVMEHHAPHKGPQDSQRSVRPYGSSTFLKWPDFGYGLKPEEVEGVYEWQKTRFPRVRSRMFPEYVRWGNPNSAEWPWVACHQDENGNFH